MPKLNGLFEYFPNLGSIDPEKIIASLNHKIDHGILLNQLYNRLLYPQTVPVSSENLFLDLAILAEVLRSNPQKYYDLHFKRIYIPENLLNLFPDLQQLIWIFIDVFATPGITKIFLRSENLGTRTLGTLIRPKVLSKDGWVFLWVHDKKYEVKLGSLMIIPVPNNRVDIKFESPAATILQKNNVATEVAGGQFGLVIDTRL